MLYFFAGILYIFSFPNFNLTWLAWGCLIPLIIAVDKEKDLAGAVRNSFICSWIIFLGSMYWLINVTVIGWIVVTFYMAWYIVFFAVIRFYNKSFIAIPVAWTALEFIRGNFLGGIPWLLLGSSQYSFLSLIQISNIAGVWGVTFVVALVNAGILYAMRKKIVYFAVALLVFAAVILYGRFQLSDAKYETGMRIGIVQPDVPQDIKWDPGATGRMLDILEDLTYRIDKADLIVWPETAVPTLTEDEKTLDRVSLTVKKAGADFIVGSQGVDEKKNYYNSAFFLSGNGMIRREYRKIHLVPFGEFVPFGDVFPFLKKLTPIEDGFSPGREYTVFKGMSALICFEDIFPNLARQFVKRGAQILVNITNDGWFGKTNAICQHAYLGVFRAVENRVPLVRATNTGLSCFIEHTGKIYSVKPFEKTSFAREILVKNETTFYTKYGDVFGWLCIVCLFITGGINVGRIKEAVGRA